MEYGIRAGFKLLRNYITGFNGLCAKQNTIEKIVQRWAPPTENATRNYIDFVSSDSGIPAHQKIAFSDKAKLVAIVDAMIFVECGQRVSRDVISSAYDML